MKALLFFALVITSFSATADQKTYGKLFVLDDRGSALNNSVRIGSGLLLDNDLVSSNIFNIDYSYRTKQWISLGVSSITHSSKLSSIGEKLKGELSDVGIVQKVNMPTYSFYLVASILPASNITNLFNSFYLNSELKIGVGIGSSYYIDRNSEGKSTVASVMTEIAIEFPLFEKYSVDFFWRHQLDDPISEKSYSENHLGVMLGAKW